MILTAEVVSSEIIDLKPADLPVFEYQDLCVLLIKQENLPREPSAHPRVKMYFSVESKEENFDKTADQFRDFITFFFGLISLNYNVKHVSHNIERLIDHDAGIMHIGDFYMWPKSSITPSDTDYIREIENDLLNLSKDVKNKIYKSMGLVERAKRTILPEQGYLSAWNALNVLMDHIGHQRNTKENWKKSIEELQRKKLITEKQKNTLNSRFDRFYGVRTGIYFKAKNLKEYDVKLEDLVQMFKEFLALFVKCYLPKGERVSIEGKREQLMKGFMKRKPRERWNVKGHVYDAITGEPLPGVKVTLKRSPSIEVTYTCSS